MPDTGPITHKQQPQNKNPKSRIIQNGYIHPVFPSFIGNCLIITCSEYERHESL